MRKNEWLCEAKRRHSTTHNDNMLKFIPYRAMFTSYLRPLLANESEKPFT